MKKRALEILKEKDTKKYNRLVEISKLEKYKLDNVLFYIEFIKSTTDYIDGTSKRDTDKHFGEYVYNAFKQGHVPIPKTQIECLELFKKLLETYKEVYN